MIPGLHVGRNLGVQMARADIVSYLDDDVIVQPGWAAAIVNRFKSDNNIVLIGGPCRPKWESEQPEWLNHFIKKDSYRWELSELSLIDLGDSAKEISAFDVYGCNFSIRRDILLKIGGFHPDGMPLNLLKYRGDGESGISRIIQNSNTMKTFYEPAAAVDHLVPADRLNCNYFTGIARRGAYGEAFSVYRKIHKEGSLQILKEINSRIMQLIFALIDKYIRNRKSQKRSVYTPKDYWVTAQWHILVHLLRILTSRNLRRWVTQDKYFEEDWCPYVKGPK